MCVCVLGVGVLVFVWFFCVFLFGFFTKYKD